MDDAVLLRVENGIATLTLNRPERLNALSQEVMQLFDRHVATLEKLPDLRVVIVTGSGRAFSAGGDLLEFETALTADKQRLLAMLRFNQRALTRLERLPVPVIGAANGTAVAGGLELLLCCDLILAAAGSRLGDGHARYGVVPAGGATARLPKRIGTARAAELFYTAKLVEVATLATWGLVNEVVPAAQLMDCALMLAREIAQASPEAVRHAKALTAGDRATDERLEAELGHFAAHLEGRDLVRGLAAFRAKQPPSY